MYMNNKHASALLLAVSLTAVSGAQILASSSSVGYDNQRYGSLLNGTKFGYTEDFDSLPNIPQYALGHLLSPDTITHPGGPLTGVETLSLVDGYYSSTLIHANMTGDGGALAASASPGERFYMLGLSSATATLNVTLASAGIAIFDVWNTTSVAHDISNWSTIGFVIDGTTQKNVNADGSFVASLGAGSHELSIYWEAQSVSGPGEPKVVQNYITSDFNMTVFSQGAPVPEPTTMCVLGVGMLGLIKRKRA